MGISATGQSTQQQAAGIVPAGVIGGTVVAAPVAWYLGKGTAKGVTAGANGAAKLQTIAQRWGKLPDMPQIAGKSGLIGGAAAAAIAASVLLVGASSGAKAGERYEDFDEESTAEGTSPAAIGREAGIAAGIGAASAIAAIEGATFVKKAAFGAPKAEITGAMMKAVPSSLKWAGIVGVAAASSAAAVSVLGGDAQAARKAMRPEVNLTAATMLFGAATIPILLVGSGAAGLGAMAISKARGNTMQWAGVQGAVAAGTVATTAVVAPSMLQVPTRFAGALDAGMRDRNPE